MCGAWLNLLYKLRAPHWSGWSFTNQASGCLNTLDNGREGEVIMLRHANRDAMINICLVAPALTALLLGAKVSGFRADMATPTPY